MYTPSCKSQLLWHSVAFSSVVPWVNTSFLFGVGRTVHDTTRVLCFSVIISIVWVIGTFGYSEPSSCQWVDFSWLEFSVRKRHGQSNLSTTEVNFLWFWKSKIRSCTWCPIPGWSLLPCSPEAQNRSSSHGRGNGSPTTEPPALS